MTTQVWAVGLNINKSVCIIDGIAAIRARSVTYFFIGNRFSIRFTRVHIFYLRLLYIELWFMQRHAMRLLMHIKQNWRKNRPVLYSLKKRATQSRPIFKSFQIDRVDDGKYHAFWIECFATWTRRMYYVFIYRAINYLAYVDLGSVFTAMSCGCSKSSTAWCGTF